MKIFKSLFAYVAALLLAFNFAACSDWGQMDPPAGNDVYPDRSVVTTFPFEYGTEDEYMGDITSAVSICEVVEDEDLQSNVLHIGETGYARIANPFNDVKLQNGFAITFWLKTAGIPQEQEIEGEEEAEEEADPVVEDDLTGAYLSFGSDTIGAERFYITTNGQLYYSKPGNLQSQNLNENDPATCTTGVLPAGGWHFVALQISDEGYQFYIDGNKSLSGSQPLGNAGTTFDYDNLIRFINNAPYLFIGKGAGDNDVDMTEMWIEDIRLIRNLMNDTDWAMPKKGIFGNDSSDDEGEDLSQYTYIIGEEDNSTAWWSAFSDYITIPAGQEARLRFINYTAGTGNWQNWNLCLATSERGAADYAEYFVIRSDLYGWGGAAGVYDGNNWSSVGYPTNDDEWATFRQNMNGAIVDLTIRRDGAEVYVTAVATCPDGTVYQEDYHQTCGDGTQDIKAFLICDGSHLAFNPSRCNVVDLYDVTTTTVGAEDNSTAWWTVFSDYFSIPVNKTASFTLENHTAGTGNYQNWNLCVHTDADRGAGDYAEYFVIRSDLYGWGASYNGDNWSNVGYPTNDDEWSLFRQEMEGATVTITINRAGAEVYVTAVANCLSGKVYQEDFHATCGDGSQVIRAFFICDGSHFIMDPNNCYIAEPAFPNQ